MALSPHASEPAGVVPHDPCAEGSLLLAQGAGLCRAGLHGGGGVHGPGQLGHRPRRRSALRVHPAQRHPALQPDGDSAPGAGAQAGHRHRQRSGAGLPRPLLAAGQLRALGAVRDRHRRLRPGRGDRLGHRAQPAVRHSAGLGRVPHRVRRAADSAAPEQGLPLPRGAGHHPGGDDRRLLCR